MFHISPHGTKRPEIKQHRKKHSSDRSRSFTETGFILRFLLRKILARPSGFLYERTKYSREADLPGCLEFRLSFFNPNYAAPG
jgi:hypothetical protein